MYCSELISSVPSWNLTFVEKNYMDAEVTYCKSQPYPATSFAACWAGKEAGASLKDIEILPEASGAPQVILHGDAKSAAQLKGITKIHILLSNSDMSYLPLISYHLRV